MIPRNVVASKRGFTLLEICIAIFLAMLVVTMAVPSLSGILDGREEEESFAEFDALVQEARQRSLEERRAWVLEWQRDRVMMRPLEGLEHEGATSVSFDPKEETLAVKFPTALLERPQPIWAFWPSGNCEAAEVNYSKGKRGWRALYHPLTGRAEVEYLER